MALGATDINSDPGCGKVMDQVMALSHSPGLDNIMTRVAALATQISLAPTAAQPLDANMAIDYSPDLRHPCGPWQQPWPGASTQALTIGEPWTIAPAAVRHSHWCGPTPGTYMGLSDNRSYRHQLRPPQLFQGLRSKPGLGHSPGPDISLDSGGQLAILISQFLTILISRDPLSSQSTSHSPCPFCPTPYHVLSHHTGAQLPSVKALG